jgi:hypothetical protein
VAVKAEGGDGGKGLEEDPHRELFTERMEQNGENVTTKHTSKELWGTNERGDGAMVHSKMVDRGYPPQDCGQGSIHLGREERGEDESASKE